MMPHELKRLSRRSFSEVVIPLTFGFRSSKGLNSLSQESSLEQNAPSSLTSVRLAAVIFSQPDLLRATGEPLRDVLHLPLTIAATRVLSENELSERLISSYLRPTDVPLAFHREWIHDVNAAAYQGALRSKHESSEKLDSYGRLLQYRFSDGLILPGNQILYHLYSKMVPRHLLPLTVNITSDLRERIRPPRVPHWQIEADQAMVSVLVAAARTGRLARQNSEVEAVEIYFAHDVSVDHERRVALIETVDLGSQAWGPWRISTELPEPVSGVHYGRARVELDPQRLGDLHGLAQSLFVDVAGRRLIFHGFADQLQRIKTRLPLNPHESGLSLHLSGHSNIQSSISEIKDLWDDPDAQLPVHPRTFHIASENIKPRLGITGDGSFHLSFDIATDFGVLEMHGLPASSSYLLFNMQLGLGATTGYSNTQIAHARRGLKRERDLKILKSVGYSTLIFFEAANFALGRPLSDGTVCESEQDVCESLFIRLGALILKSEGWPLQSGSLGELCSKNVLTLIEGFVRQVVADFKGRDLSIYLPQGEFSLSGVSRTVVQLFFAMVSDLAQLTQGSCFTKARAKSFENFLSGRQNPEREDVAVRGKVSSEINARLIYQPGINERYIFPDQVRPPHGTEVLNLLREGFTISIDGKEVEEFSASEFRPEFTLHEGSDPEASVPTAGHKIDWFELHPKFFFKGDEITGEQAIRLSREGLLEFRGRLYRVKREELPSLQRLTQFWSGIQAHNAGLTRSKRRKTEDTYYHLPRSQTLELLALRASGVKIRGGSRWDEICQFYDSLDQVRPPMEIPASFMTELQPYQKTGVQWIRDLHRLGLGGILADDMGLGKTVTSLAFLESLRVENRMGACLVLVPTSLTYNWLSEATRFAPQMPVKIFSSREAESTLDFLKNNSDGMVICTYGLLQENAEFFQQVSWSMLILDEAQNLKNITTKRTTAARKLAASFKLCLTGTPIENHYGELYSLFDLIVTGALGDLPSFREKYVNPVRVLREDIDFLRMKTKPLILRRTKSQVMHELPPKIEATVKLPFEEEQKQIYRDIATAYNDQVRTAISKQGEAKSQLQMLTALLRLRQVCSDPSSIPGVKYSGEPPKISTLIEALKELTAAGASALVFTQFLATFERIRTGLAAAKVPIFDICGSDTRLARERKIRQFQEFDGGAVMLMTLKTGGVGLNLVKASYIFHIEPWWNPAVENQATDRAHRIGQTKTVQVYRYIIKDSVEEKIEVLKDIKSKRFDAMFSNTERDSDLGQLTATALTQRDFEFLLE